MSILPVAGFNDPKAFASSTRENALFYLRFVTRRYVVLAVTLVALTTLIVRILYYDGFPRTLSVDLPLGLSTNAPSDPLAVEDPRWPGRRLPPLYSQWHQRDLALPQQHWNAASHESEPKFFAVPGHTRGMHPLVSLEPALLR